MAFPNKTVAGTTETITTATATGRVYTFTTLTDHLFVPGASVTISGATSGSSYNNTFTVNTVSDTVVGTVSGTSITPLNITTTAGSTSANLSGTTGLKINTTYSIYNANIPQDDGITFSIGASLPSSPYTITLNEPSTTGKGKWTGPVSVISVSSVVSGREVPIVIGQTVTGTGIPSNTKVTTVNYAQGVWTIGLSNATTTSSGTSVIDVSLSFSSISAGTNVPVTILCRDVFTVVSSTDTAPTGTPTTAITSDYTINLPNNINLSNQFALSQPGTKDPVVSAKPANKISSDLSGFIINQNLPYVANVNNVATTLDQNALDQSNNPITYTTQNYIAQEFKLPSNFARSTKNPKITGLQLNLDTSTSFELKYSLQTYNSLYGWRRIFEGSYKNSSATTGKKWLPINFEPFEIDTDYLNQKFRIVITKVSGINKIYYSDKSPFTEDSCNFYYNATTTPVLITGALRFRLMGDVADNGTDILGNQYRSLVYSQAASNVVDLNTNTWWVSKANPSKYGVESLYFDFGKKDVVDAIFLDPVTPNVNFNVYYYDGSEAPGTSTDSWDSLLWKRISKQFTATKRQNYLFPTPVYARYIKVEFTSLQAQSYLTGDFQKPVRYKKHPQWVLDYFLSIYAYLNNETYDPFIQNQVDVSFDVLQLAFNYYKGDIIQTSTNPQDLKVVNESTDNLDQTIRNLLIKNADGVESLDVTTYAKVKKSFDPFMDHPAMRSNFDSVLSNIILNNAQSANYPVEDKMITQAGTATVSTQDRNHLISEKTVPHMYFFVDSRHGYREAIAKLPEGKAYFVGIKEIAFQRKDHKVLSNDNMYVTISGNNYNLQTNDFSFDGTVWSSR